MWRFRYRLPSDTGRIGIDVGGVLNKMNNDVDNGWHKDPSSEVNGAIDSVKQLVEIFGSDNVFIVSKVGRKMQGLTDTWLFKTMKICERTGFKRENVHFCRERSGERGKGNIAKKLGLTHFIDDRPQCLTSVFEDKAGNAKETIKKMYLFPRSGDVRIGVADNILRQGLSKAMRDICEKNIVRA